MSILPITLNTYIVPDNKDAVGVIKNLFKQHNGFFVNSRLSKSTLESIFCSGFKIVQCGDLLWVVCCNFTISYTSCDGIPDWDYPVHADDLLEKVNTYFENEYYDITIEPIPCESTIMELNKAGYETRHDRDTLYLTK